MSWTDEQWAAQLMTFSAQEAGHFIVSEMGRWLCFEPRPAVEIKDWIAVAFRGLQLAQERSAPPVPPADEIPSVLDRMIRLGWVPNMDTVTLDHAWLKTDDGRVVATSMSVDDWLEDVRYCQADYFADGGILPLFALCKLDELGLLPRSVG